MFTADIPYSKSKKVGEPRVSPERKNWVRRESTMILSKNIVLREKAKVDMAENARLSLLKKNHDSEQRLNRWMKKTASSPFAVDLAAETERIMEENRIRESEENNKRLTLEARKEKAKNDIILRALSEFSDLEALRREKRAIMEEEQRLRALLALEKTTVNRKDERIAAERAERQRNEAKLQYRRSKYKDSLDKVMEEESFHVKKRFDLLEDPSHPSFNVSLSHETISDPYSKK